jgi:monoamine oxidase
MSGQCMPGAEEFMRTLARCPLRRVRGHSTVVFVNAASFDTIVIGAGAAGLAATTQLAGPAHRVVLLEARDRIGGRMWTRHESGLSVPIELGAEFIHGHAEVTRTWLARANAAVIESSDRHFTLSNGVATSWGGSFENVQQAVRKQAAVLEREDMSFERFVEQHLTMLSSDERAYARMLAEGFDAADAAHASARALVAEWTGDTLGDVPQSRPEAGYGALLAALDASLAREQVRLMLGATVDSVRWSPGSVEVLGQYLNAPFQMRGTRAVIALPLGVLQAPAGSPGAVRFDPPLPDDKRQALQLLASGPVVKIMLRFATPFWQRLHGGAYRDASFFHVADAPFRTFWTQAPVQAPLLVAWAGGPRAESLAKAGTAGAIAQLALQSLGRLFGAQAGVTDQLESFYWHDWQQDPYARGAYSYVLVGGSNARAQLAEPLQNTLYFAGEATDTVDEAGTVTGALQSGLRVAHEIQ